jgi:hypothetical protein
MGWCTVTYTYYMDIYFFLLKKSNIILYACMPLQAVTIKYKIAVTCKKRTVLRGPFLWGILVVRLRCD